MLSMIWPTGTSMEKCAPRMTCRLRTRMAKLAKKTYGTNGMRTQSKLEMMKTNTTHIWQVRNVNQRITKSTTVRQKPVHAGYAQKRSHSEGWRHLRGGGHFTAEALVTGVVVSVVEQEAAAVVAVLEENDDDESMD
jgi:hypothetical protein